MIAVHDKPLAAVAHHMQQRRDQFIAETVELTKSQIRALDHDARMLDLLEASIGENILAAIHFMYQENHEGALEAPAAAITYARAVAQRDIPLSALIRAYRIVHARFLDIAMDYAATLEPCRCVVTMVELVNRGAQWIDHICEQVGQAYEHAREDWVRSGGELRQYWVNQLLSGAPVSARRAEEALRYPLDATHVAAVVWADPAVPDREVVGLFGQVRCLLGSLLSVVAPPLLVATDEREARVWLPVSSCGAAALDRLAEPTPLGDLPVRLAISRAEPGLEGFRKSIAQAQRAKTVALAAGADQPPRAVKDDRVTPLALMADDPHALRDFVAGVLGDLAGDGERDHRLRETLRLFLAHSRSFAATAETMSMHRNTIQYRVEQALQRCGHELADGETIMKLHLALDACHWLGQAVLVPARRGARSR